MKFRCFGWWFCRRIKEIAERVRRKIVRSAGLFLRLVLQNGFKGRHVRCRLRIDRGNLRC